MTYESDLYPPLKNWLESNGYEVHAEVKDCDIAAKKNDDLVIVEMKTSITLGLLLQIAERQTAHASVYAATPAPKRHDKRWLRLTRLLKRLEAGLLLVHIDSALPRVEVAFHPIPYTQPKQKSATRAILKEMSGRSTSANTGGTTRRKLLTAYRESALAVAVTLEQTGPTSPKILRRHGAPEKTPTILRGNPYGWFEHTAKAQYALTPEGKAALEEESYKDLVAALRAKIHPVLSTVPKAAKYESK